METPCGEAGTSGQFFGFYGTGGDKISSVTVSTETDARGFGVGDFALVAPLPTTTAKGQKGKKILATTAEGLIGQAQAIQGAIGCT